MVIFLITSVLLLGLVAIAIYLWQKPANQTQTTELPLPPEHGRGLFSDSAEPLELPPAAAVAALKTNEINENNVAARAHAEALIASFPSSPDRNSTLKMLHSAALADDAEIYGKAVEATLRAWRERNLNDMSATDLQALFTSEFWVLSSGTRSSGAGFVLKRALSSARRELESTNH